MELCTYQELKDFQRILKQYLTSFDIYLRNNVTEDLALKAKVDTQTLSHYGTRRRRIPKERYLHILNIIEHRPYTDKYNAILRQKWV